MLPPQDIEAEEATLGAMLVTPKLTGAVITQAGIRKDDFYRDKHREIFAAICSLYSRGEGIDALTVAAELERLGKPDAATKDFLTSLAATVPAPGNAAHYGTRVAEKAELRRRLDASNLLREHVETEDPAKFEEALAHLSGSRASSSDTLRPAELAERLRQVLNSGGVERFPLPWPKLNRLCAGGLRRQEVSLVGAWTSMGKSVVLDQILEGVHREGKRAHLFINEMSIEQRGLRYVTRHTGVPFSRLLNGDIQDADRAVIDKALGDVPYSITDASGWTAERIAQEIIARKVDVAAIDVLHLISRPSADSDERALAAISQVLNRTAKRADCHIVAAVHLNEARAQTVSRPRPVLRDIRGSGMLKNDADAVMFLHREQDSDTGDPLPAGELYFAKLRNGILGRAAVNFESARMRFEAA